MEFETVSRHRPAGRIAQRRCRPGFIIDDIEGIAVLRAVTGGILGRIIAQIDIDVAIGVRRDRDGIRRPRPAEIAGGRVEKVKVGKLESGHRLAEHHIHREAAADIVTGHKIDGLRGAITRAQTDRRCLIIGLNGELRRRQAGIARRVLCGCSRHIDRQRTVRGGHDQCRVDRRAHRGERGHTAAADTDVQLVEIRHILGEGEGRGEIAGDGRHATVRDRQCRTGGITFITDLRRRRIAVPGHILNAISREIHCHRAVCIGCDLEGVESARDRGQIAGRAVGDGNIVHGQIDNGFGEDQRDTGDATGRRIRRVQAHRRHGSVKRHGQRVAVQAIKAGRILGRARAE